jgi:hypothetical protein
MGSREDVRGGLHGARAFGVEGTLVLAFGRDETEMASLLLQRSGKSGVRYMTFQHNFIISEFR